MSFQGSVGAERDQEMPASIWRDERNIVESLAEIKGEVVCRSRQSASWECYQNPFARNYGVRWQAKRDTALELADAAECTKSAVVAPLCRRTP